MLKYEMYKNNNKNNNRNDEDNSIIFISEYDSNNNYIKNKSFINCDIINSTMIPSTINENNNIRNNSKVYSKNKPSINYDTINSTTTQSATYNDNNNNDNNNNNNNNNDNNNNINNIKNIGKLYSKNKSFINCDIINSTMTPGTTDENHILNMYNDIQENDLNMNEIIENDRKENGTNTELSTDDMNDINYRKEKLYKNINENKKKISTSLYIISSKYDLIYFRYNRISLLILIISTITTFVEAIRLTLINYENDNPEGGISKYISKDTISLMINLLSLILGTILTIFSSIVKFRNYRENMEKLKNIHDTLFNYKCLYNKQKDYIDYFSMSNNLTLEIFNRLVDNVENINKEIKDISIFENIRIRDIIKFNKIKVNHDIKLKELGNKRELEFLKLSIESAKNKKKYDINNSSLDLMNMKKRNL